jgi:parallel beta-helix repeat protein
VSDQSAAFMSYVRFNDQHDDGQLTQFRERLSAEVQVQTGEEFPIFQDRNDIAWGQAWQQRIDQTLDAVTLLIVIITPAFFRSPACRAEVNRFLGRERELGRQDLILPVYYVSTPDLDNPKLREGDDLAQVIASRQFTDWRDLRFEPFTSPLVRKKLAQLAARMRDTFWRAPSGAPHQTGRRGEAVASKAKWEELSGGVMLTPKTEPPTHVVDPYERGDFTTVTAAIRNARPGDRILVRPGLYQEGLVIDKPLEILGDGQITDIEIQANGADALLFKANIGRVVNLTLRQTGGEGGWYGVDITQGRLELEGCDITSASRACVGIHNGADPRLRRNTIHAELHTGVNFYENGLGTLEDNEIICGVYAGSQIGSASNPTLRRNRIHGGTQGGVLVYENGLGVLEDNEIIDSGTAAVEIKSGGNPVLRRNRINGSRTSGVYVHDNGSGTLEDNEISDNISDGVWIGNSGNLVLRGNRINRNGQVGIRVLNGKGLFENNDLTDNEQGAWHIAGSSDANVTRTGNRE